MKVDEKTVQAITALDHKECYATGAVGQSTLYDFRIGFYNKSGKVKTKKDKFETVHEINTTVILPHQPVKELAIWMMMHYLEYEEKHDDLPLEEVPLENLITVLEKIKKYDIEDLKVKLAEIKEEPKKKHRKAIIKKKIAKAKKRK